MKQELRVNFSEQLLLALSQIIVITQKEFTNMIQIGTVA